MTIHGIPTPRAVTLADVAREAGVSRATASKALNGRPDVGEGTRARIAEIAARLQFSPNLMARGLMTGRTGSVGILTSDWEGRFSSPIMFGAEDALGAQETVAIMTSSRGRPDLERRHLRALTTRRVDGLIVVGHVPAPRDPIAGADGVPTVYVYAPSRAPGDVSFVPDHEQAGRIATEHLLATGRTRLAFLGGPDDPARGGEASTLRARGFATALAAAGLVPVGGHPLAGDWLEQWGWDGAARLLDAAGRGPRPDGLVCANDQIARGALDLLGTRGIDVPGDVAVVGFDDWELFTVLGRRTQSSVGLDLPELGRRAALAILDPAGAAPGVHALPGRLAARSTSCPPGGVADAGGASTISPRGRSAPR